MQSLFTKLLVAKTNLFGTKGEPCRLSRRCSKSEKMLDRGSERKWKVFFYEYKFTVESKKNKKKILTRHLGTYGEVWLHKQYQKRSYWEQSYMSLGQLQPSFVPKSKPSKNAKY